MTSWRTFHIVTSPRRGLQGIVFTLSACRSVRLSVCLSVCMPVCVCVWPIFWYFISRLLEEISIWNLYRILIELYSIHLHRSRVKVTGTVLCFFECTVIILSQKLSNNFCFHRHLLGYSIQWNNKNLSEQRNDDTKTYVNIWLWHVKLLCRIYYFS